MKPPRLYDRDLRLVAILEGAAVSLDRLRLNDLSTISFTLPAGDPANELCLDRRFVEVFDGEESAGIFRITGSPDSELCAPGARVRYEAEHAIATLLDDVFPAYTQFGGQGVSTAQTIAFVLSRQTRARWQPGTCAFNRAFEHKWEHDDLLSALFSVARPFADPFWTYDFSTSPWTVNLERLPGEPSCEARFGRNLRGLRRARDSRCRVSKLYCLGYGEGVNQLGIAAVNGGLDYLLADGWDPDDPAVGVFVDRSVQDPLLLKSLGEEALRRAAAPRVSYRLSALDLSAATGLAWDRLSVGKLIRVHDGRDSFDARVMEACKPDPAGDPGALRLTLASAGEGLGESLGSLADRARIGLLASQGATNMYAQQFADNCDRDSPMEIRFFIPKNCARINRVLLSWEYEPFRAYSKSAASGGGETVTSAGISPGSVTGSNPDSQSGEWGPATVTASAAQGSTGSGGGGTTGSAGDHAHTVFSAPGSTGTTGSHSHNLSSHSHGLGSHTHSATLPAHSHLVGGHSHSMGAHTHSVSISGHSHGLIYGIYEGPKVQSAALCVDGEAFAHDKRTGLDITAGLARDGEGRILRDAWHRVTLTPEPAPGNAEALTRICASLFVQTFVRSLGGGDH